MTCEIAPPGIHAASTKRPSGAATRASSAAAASGSGAKMTAKTERIASALPSATGRLGRVAGQERRVESPFGRLRAGDLEQARSGIHPGDRGAALGGEERRVAGAAADVEHPLAGSRRRPLDDQLGHRHSCAAVRS